MKIDILVADLRFEAILEKEKRERVDEGYLTTDEEFLKEDVNGGACCVTALIHQEDLVVSNAGDCRAVMYRGGVVKALTVDHRPSREDEKERIQNNVSTTII
ncbi:protein phosphatase [Lithospermum erythrorhizon]|uniref:Protein phosphatase n=1 Tax=Lithospermum erythrorhizon TaxID=34254 RepID=A0AAV3QFH8_LITER